MLPFVSALWLDAQSLESTSALHLRNVFFETCRQADASEPNFDFLAKPPMRPSGLNIA